MQRNDEISILIIDDDAELQSLWDVILKRKGFNTFTASDGAKGLEILSSEKPDLVVLDIMLPDISGLNVCKSIKSNPAYRDVFVILASSQRSSSENISEGLETGADGYLVKPLGEREFLAHVEAAARVIRAEKALLESEKLFRSIFEQSNVAKSITYLSGEIRVNNAFCEMLGYSANEMKKKVWQDITHPDDIAIDVSYVESLLKGEKNQARWEKRYLHKNGTSVYGDLNTVLHRSEKGTPLYFITNVIDITQRRIAEATLAEEHNLLQTVINNSPDHIYIKDEFSRFLLVNESAARFLNASPLDLMGKTDFDFYPRPLAEQYFSDEQEIIRTGKPVINKDEPRKNPDGSVTWILTTKIPFRNQAGEITGIAGISKDITRRKRMEDALKESEEDLSITLNSIGDGVIATDHKGRIVRMNPIAEKMCGWTLEQARGRKLSEVFHIINAHSRKRILDPVQEVLDRGVIVGLSNHTVLISRHGTEYHIADSAAPIRNRENETTGVVLVFSDVSEKYKAQKALDEMFSNFRNLFTNMTEGVAIHELVFDDAGNPVDYTILDVNPAYTRHTSLKREDVVNKTSSAIYGIKAPYLDIFSRVALHGTPESFDVYFEPMNRFFSISVCSTGAGRFVTIFQDITERRIAEQALKESEEKFSVLFHQSPVAMSLTSAVDGKFYDVNDFFIAESGYTREELIGFTPSDLGFDEPGEREKLLDELIRNGAVQGQPIIFNTKTGKKPYIISVSNVKISGNRYLLSTVFNIGDLKEAESKVREVNLYLERRVADRTAELTAANKELEAFAYTVSHDLRAPVRAIGGFTRILAEEYIERLDDEGKRICSVIGENTRKMEHLIDDLLAFSRLSRVEMRHTRVNMKLMVAEILNDSLPPEKRDIIRFTTGNVPEATGDHAMLAQVWSNLLSNAIKYSSHKEIPVITIDSQTTADELIYWVEDNGTGFDMKYVDKLFGVFQRLHSTREYEGTGVGLAIVQRIIHRHGGRVWAEGMPEKGAKFYFSLKKSPSADLP